MTKWICTVFVLGTIACNTQIEKYPDPVEEKIRLLQSDKAFSNMSLEKGMNAAFIHFMDSNAVLLRKNYMPVIGMNTIDYLIQQNDTSYTIVWQSQNAIVSKSADMGFTYGVYAVHPNNIDTVLYGTYVNIWKKDAQGDWKIILDSGNEGIERSTTEF
ncbi:MAG: hypothetical protein WD135_01875 [Ferruginibacter sp.]